MCVGDSAGELEITFMPFTGAPSKLHCYCVLCKEVIQLFAVTGEEFTIPLLFPVSMFYMLIECSGCFELTFLHNFIASML